MKKQEYERIEQYMLSCMKDSAHDKDHVYRVLGNALTIARDEADVIDMDVLLAACLLHDIGRPEQFADKRLCHAQVGGDKAYAFLVEMGWEEARAAHVRSCIRSHRYRKSEPPASVEAKILYDADKLDVAGAIGIARTLVYNGTINRPIYTTLPDGTILDGEGDEESSFFREYRFKLEHVYDRFLTKTGAEMAKARQKAAEDFYRSIWQEVNGTMNAGRLVLDEVLE